MPIPKNKSQLLASITDTYGKLRKDIERVPVEAAFFKEMKGHAKGTVMSPANLISYLIGWGELVLKWHETREAGKAIDFPEKGFKWTELGELAQKFYKDYEALTWAELITKLDETLEKVLFLIENESEATLYDEPFYKNYPLGRMIQLNTSSPYKNARGRLRKWLRG